MPKSFCLCFRKVLWLVHFYVIKPFFFSSKGENGQTNIVFFACENQVNNLLFSIAELHVREYFYVLTERIISQKILYSQYVVFQSFVREF